MKSIKVEVYIRKVEFQERFLLNKKTLHQWHKIFMHAI